MESFREVLDLVKKIDINQMLSKIMDDLSDSLIKINQDDQLDFGIDARGQVIETLASTGGNVYAQKTIEERKNANKQIKNVDLNFTGKFWRTFKVQKVAQGWEVTADFNLYDTDIRANFSTKFDFLGLTPENLEDFVLEKVFPLLEIEIKKQLKI